MTTPNRVRASVEQLAGNGGSLDERIDRLDVRGTPTVDELADLAEIARAWVGEGFGSFSAIDALGDELSVAQLHSAEGELRLSFGKAPTTSTFYFLTPRGLAVLLNDKNNAANARRVLVAEDFAAFATVGCTYEPWTEMVADAAPLDDTNLPIPRRIVRDQIAIVPLSVGPLLLVQMPKEDSDVYQTWRAAACSQLLTCLCDEVWRQDADIFVTLAGPRKRKLLAELEAVDLDRDMPLVSEAADWVYKSGRDAETRHTLFVYELAREWPDETPFVTGFSDRAAGALEAARTAYRMHIRDASKETLKSLQDLRKTLADDVTRVVTQTRELTSILWRDLLVVFAAILGRFTLLSTPDTREAGFADMLLYGLAVYLFASIGITLTANHRFMTIFREAQAQWRTKLFGFVDPADFATLATGPLGEAEKTYRWIRNAAIAAYGMTIFTLIALAIMPSAKLAHSVNKVEQTASASLDSANASRGHVSNAVGPGQAAETAPREPATISPVDYATDKPAGTDKVSKTISPNEDEAKR